MKNKFMKISLIVAFVSLIAGLSLSAIGFTHKGLTQLQTATSPENIQLTVEAVDTLDIQLVNRSASIEPTSPDNKIHISYKQLATIDTPVTVSVANQVLQIQQSYNDFPLMSSPLTILGEALNQREETFDVLIQVPKNLKLKKINNDTGSWQRVKLSDLTVQELTGGQNYHLERVTANSGKLSSYEGYFFAEDSHLKNFTIDVSSSSFTLNNTTLEEVNFTVNSWLHRFSADKLTILGNVSFQVASGDFEMSLSPESKQAIDFDVAISSGEDEVAEDYYYSGPYYGYELTVADDLQKGAQLIEDYTFQKSVANPKGKLTFKGTSSIDLRLK